MLDGGRKTNWPTWTYLSCLEAEGRGATSCLDLSLSLCLLYDLCPDINSLTLSRHTLTSILAKVCGGWHYTVCVLCLQAGEHLSLGRDSTILKGD